MHDTPEHLKMMYLLDQLHEQRIESTRCLDADSRIATILGCMKVVIEDIEEGYYWENVTNDPDVVAMLDKLKSLFVKQEWTIRNEAGPIELSISGRILQFFQPHGYPVYEWPLEEGEYLVYEKIDALTLGETPNVQKRQAQEPGPW